MDAERKPLGYGGRHCAACGAWGDHHTDRHPAPTERTGATDSEVEEAGPAWQAGYEAGQNVGGVRGYRQGYADAVGAAVPRGESQRTAEERLAAVLVLHVPSETVIPDDGRHVCNACKYLMPWPCPTVRAAGAS